MRPLSATARRIIVPARLDSAPPPSSLSAHPALGAAALGALAWVMTACQPSAQRAYAPPPAPPTQISITSAAPTALPILPASASPVTFDRMTDRPVPGWQVPQNIAFAPTGEITFLEAEPGAERDQLSLWTWDAAKGEARVLMRASDFAATTPSREEELRRERQRQRNKGITQYAWARDVPLLVVPSGGDVFVRDASGTVTRATATPAPELDPKPCPTGARVAWVRGGELYEWDVASKRERWLTRAGAAGVTHGLTDFNAQEEFGESSGYQWAPECNRIALFEVDEREVGVVPVLGHRNGAPDLMQQRYPASGSKNAKVKLGLLDVATLRLAYVTPPDAGERYYGRLAFTRDGRWLHLQALSRDQHTIELWRVNAASGALTVVAKQTSPAWVRFSDFRASDDGETLVWVHTDGAHAHVVLHDPGGSSRAITSGDWDVDRLVSLTAKDIAFTATREGPLERHLYTLPLGGGEPRRLTELHGVHQVTTSSDGQRYVDVHSAIDRLPQAQVFERLDGPAGTAPHKPLGTLPTQPDPDLAALKPRAPELVRFSAADGTPLYAAVLAPRDLRPGVKYPAIVMVYGGPGVQTVQDVWAPRLMWQHLADRGFVVFQLDNRGSAGRGPAFEAATYGHLGDVEIADQVRGAAYLSNLPYVDGARIGIYGHSYGGYLAARALLDAPGTFAAGVAGSPVTDWALYDTGYTERFMGTPTSNAAGYAASRLADKAARLTAPLLVVHALMDENVHFQNTADLVDALVRADKDFDLLVFPGERHGYRTREAEKYALRRIIDFFTRHLSPPHP